MPETNDGIKVSTLNAPILFNMGLVAIRLPGMQEDRYHGRWAEGIITWIGKIAGYAHPIEVE